jgi:hypothetical protein
LEEAVNRRGFLGLLGKLVAVGTAMSVSPAVLAPLKHVLPPTGTVALGTTTEVLIKNTIMSGPVWTLAS